MLSTSTSNVVPIGSGYVKSSFRLNQFSFHHVESLLNQSADLLERALKEKGAYDSLLEAAKRFYIELDRRVAAQLIEEDRITARAHRMELEALEAEMRNAGSIEQNLIDAKNYYDLAQRTEKLGPGQSHAYAASFQAANASLVTYQGVRNKNRIVGDTLAGEVGRRESGVKASRAELDALRDSSTPGSGSPLDFDTRLKSMLGRLNNDFQNAYDRLTVASDGLQKIYGYGVALPQVSGSPRDFDAVVLWLRDALQWLAAFSQRDQGIVKIISLRSVLGEAIWKKRIAKLPAEDILVPFPNEVFDGYNFVRLRGLSAVVDTKAPSGPIIELEIKLPEIARFKHGGGRQVIVDQSKLPRCAIGRVESRYSARTPELCGLISLFNASPLGDNSGANNWLVSVFGVSKKDNDLSLVNDVLIEVNFVAQEI